MLSLVSSDNNKNNINQNDHKDENPEKEETISYKSKDNVNYRLSLTSLIAEVIQSPEASNDVLIPTFIEYQSKQFKILHICDEAFKNSSIKSLSFSKDSEVQQIGNFAFDNSPIIQLNIPQSLIKLSKQWIQGADELNEIKVDEKNPCFTNESGFLIYTEQNQTNNNSSREIFFAPRNFEGEFLIPKEIKSIGRFAFNKRQGLLLLKSESSVLEKIKSFCFFQCKNLRNVSLKGQSDLLLGGCCFSQSENLLSVEISCKTITIGQNCFEDCSSLSSVNLNIDDRVSLGSHAFKGCSRLENILIFKASSIKIGDECFADAINLKSAIFVANSIILGNDILKNCQMLSNISIESRDDIIITSNTFKNCNLKCIKLVTSAMLKLNDSCFNSKNLEKIELSFKLVHVGKNCFSQCPSISSITFQSEEEIHLLNEFFVGCNSLKKLFLTSKSNIFISDKFMNEFTNLEIVEISGQIISFDSNCFNNCQSLSNFSITNSNEVKLKENQFVNCNKLEQITIQSSILNICQNQICNFESLKHIVISSNSQLYLKSNCFDGFINTESISISGENISIEENCFKNCSNLNKIEFKKATNLEIGSNVFNGCSKLKVINLNADSNLTLNDDCFNGSCVEEASFESKNVIFGKSCFESHLTNKSQIVSINIKGEKVNIGDSCFNSCSLLKTFSISSSITVEIGNNAFQKCSNLENISLNADDKIRILNYCFSNSKNLKSFSISSAKNIEIGIGVFDDCTKLETVSLKAENKIDLGDYCFSKAENLKTFNFSCNEALFNENCFYGCLSLKNFINNDTNRIIFSAQAFNCCDNLENIEIKTGAEFQAGNYCFDRLLNLKKVIVKSPKIKIGDFCFNSCTALTTLSFPDVEEITYYDSYIFDCDHVNILINSKAIKSEIKSEKLEINKPFIDQTNKS